MVRVAVVEPRIRWSNQTESQVADPGELERPRRKNTGPFLATISRYLRTFTNLWRPKEPAILTNDWYQKKPTAQDQGEFWVHTLLGR